MSSISEFLEALVDEGKDFAKEELKDLIKEAKGDNRTFIRHMGELTEEFIKLRALNKITNSEFKELMSDIVDLNKMQFHKLSVQAKTRAEKIANGLIDLVVNKLIAII
tara:strand:+ start:122 stop:445 length:324 start_codon:yes stop_codon:yes gene_type:complete